MSPKVPTKLPITLVRATRAESDEALLKSWLRSLNSGHTLRNFETTARRFLAGLPEGGLRAATVEDVRDTLTSTRWPPRASTCCASNRSLATRTR